MRSKPSLVLGVALGLVLMTGCAQPALLTRAGATAAKTPAGSTAGAAIGATPGAVAARGTLADAAKQAAGAQLSTELALQLKAERAMSDAELLLASEGMAPYALAALDATTVVIASGSGRRDDRGGDDRRDPQPPPTPAAGPASPPPAPESGDDRRPADQPASAAARPTDDPRAAEQEDAPRGEAHDASKAPSDQTRQEAAKACHDRDQQRLARRAPELERRKGEFERKGEDRTTTAADGSQQVTSEFQVKGAQLLTVKRTFDDHGQLVQAVETLAGDDNGVGFDCERSRTIKPDGTEEIASDVKLTIDGKVHHVRWSRHVAQDGTPTGSGWIERPDGSQVALTSAGSAEAETIHGDDAAAGVAVQVKAADTDATAAATLDGGAAGTATVQVGLDDSAP